METFELKGPDGSVYEVRAPSAEAAVAAMRKMNGSDYVQPAPPPGVISHGADGSYIADQPDISVNTQGMSTEQRDVASRALTARGQSGFGGDLARRAMPLMQGLSLSGGDELVSGIYGATQALAGNDFSDSYNYAQEAQRQELDQARSDRPWESGITQVIGNVGSGIAMGGAGLLPSLAGRSMAARTAIGAGVGGGLGATDGFLAGSGAEDRAKGAAGGAVIGTIAGGTVPLAISGIKSGVQRLADSATTNRMLDRIGLSRPAADQLKRVVDADAPTAARSLRQSGPDAMLADAGPASRGMLDTAVQKSGLGATRTIQAVNQRVSNALSGMTKKLDDVLGSPRGVSEASRDIRQGSSAARSAAYDAADAVPIDYASNSGRQIESLFPRIPRQAIREANALMKLNGQASNQILIDLTEDGTVSFRQMPNVRQLDYIKRGLAQVAEQLDGTGAMAGQSTKGKAYQDLAMDLRTALARAVPEYDVAMKTAREPIQQVQAMKFGYDLLSRSTPRDVARMEIQKMTPPQMDAARMGVRSYIDELVSNVKIASSNVDREGLPALRTMANQLTTGASLQKLRALVPDRKQYMSLVRELQQAQRALLLSADTAANSRTFGRTATAQGIKDSLEPGVVGNAARGKPIEMGRSGVQSFFGTTPQDDIAREDRVYSEIVDFLTGARGPVDTRRASQALNDAYRVGTRNELLADSVAKPLGLTIGSGAYQTGQRLLDR
jgi:hypothetical protein